MALTSYLNQSITHYARDSYDKYGREVDDGDSTAYKARVQLGTKQRMLANGEVTTIDGKVFLDGQPSISVDDRIDYNSVKYRVFGIKENVDGQGNVHHLTLEIQKVVS